MNTDEHRSIKNNRTQKASCWQGWRRPLAFLICVYLFSSVANSFLVAADVESRVLTHYVPQDSLESAVRKEGWTEVPLAVKGGVRKGDVVRLWTGGSIDRGGERPGENVNGPTGAPGPKGGSFALSAEAGHAFALLFKTETPGIRKPAAPGKPLEIKLSKDGERLWLGFNDLRGAYHDNHIGKGRRHERDPLWLRVEVVRIVVD
jgi:hypothetical protein